MFIFLGVGRVVHFCACSSILRLNHPESSTGIHRNGSLREQRQGLCFRFFFPVVLHIFCIFIFFIFGGDLFFVPAWLFHGPGPSDFAVCVCSRTAHP